MPEQIEIVHIRKTSKPVNSPGSDRVSLSPVIRKLEKKSRKTLESHKLANEIQISHPQCNRSVELQVSHFEITHDDPANAEIIDTESQFALPSNLLAAGVLHVFLGIVSLSISIVFFTADSAVEIYLEVSRSHSHYPAFFFFVSEVLTVLAGLGLIVCLLYNIELFFRLYPHFLWIIVMFDFVSIMFSIGSWRYMNMSTYSRIFESEAMIFCEGNYDYYNILWNRPADSMDPEPRIWGKLESTLRCCGINGVEDWEVICKGKVPTSCCRENSRHECHQIFKMNFEVDNFSVEENSSPIRHLLYQKRCPNVLALEASSIQRDWIVFPLIVTLFDLILMFNGNHKAREICFKLRSSKGREELAQFRTHFWKTSKYKPSKVNPLKTKNSLEELLLSSEDSRADYDPGHPFGNNEFVTDRESLRGLINTSNSDDRTVSYMSVESIPLKNQQPN